MAHQCACARPQRHFATEAGWEALSALQLRGPRCILRLDFGQLKVHSRSEDLVMAMEHQPHEAIACIAAAVHEVSHVCDMSRVPLAGPAVRTLSRSEDLDMAMQHQPHEAVACIAAAGRPR